jgi:hypothetical protein
LVDFNNFQKKIKKIANALGGFQNARKKKRKNQSRELAAFQVHVKVSSYILKTLKYLKINRCFKSNKN